MRNLAAAIRSMKDKEPISNVGSSLALYLMFATDPPQVVEEVIQAANIEEVPTRLPQALVKALRAAISEDIRHEQCERKGQGKKPLMLADRDSLSANTPTWALAEHIAADPLVREFTQEYRKSVAVKAYVSALMLAYPEVVDVGDVPEKEDST